jgi:hypothetical protein
MEAIKTNILGSGNVIEAALERVARGPLRPRRERAAPAAVPPASLEPRS